MQRLTIVGIVFILVGLGIFYAGSVGFENSLANNTVQYSIALGPHSTENLSFGLQNSTILIVAYHTENNIPIAFYLMNESAFLQAGSSSSNTLMGSYESLKGKGVFEIINGSALGVFPYQNSSILTYPDYEYNGTGILSNGTYYSVFQNTGNLTTVVQYSTIKKLQLTADNPFIYSNLIYDGTAGIIFLLGLGIVGYSLFAKKDDKNDDAQKENIDAMYAKYSEKPERKVKDKQMKVQSENTNTKEIDDLYAKYSEKTRHKGKGGKKIKKKKPK